MRRNGGNCEDLEGEVEEWFIQIQRLIAELRVEFIHRLRELKALSEALIGVATREVNEHLLDDKYTTADLVAKFILEAAESGMIEEGNCFAISTNQLSKETLKSFIGLKVETLRLGFPHYWDIGEEYRPQIEAKAALEAALVSSNGEMEIFQDIIHNEPFPSGDFQYFVQKQPQSALFEAKCSLCVQPIAANKPAISQLLDHKSWLKSALSAGRSMRRRTNLHYLKTPLCLPSYRREKAWK